LPSSSPPPASSPSTPADPASPAAPIADTGDLNGVAGLRVTTLYADGTRTFSDVRGPAVFRPTDDALLVGARFALRSTGAPRRGDLSLKLDVGRQDYFFGEPSSFIATYAETVRGAPPVRYAGSGQMRLELDLPRGSIRLAVALSFTPVDPQSAAPPLQVTGFIGTDGSLHGGRVSESELGALIWPADLIIDDVYFDPDVDTEVIVEEVGPEDGAWILEPAPPLDDSGGDAPYEWQNYDPNAVDSSAPDASSSTSTTTTTTTGIVGGSTSTSDPGTDPSTTSTDPASSDPSSTGTDGIDPDDF
jgi:hypothetical protein